MWCLLPFCLCATVYSVQNWKAEKPSIVEWSIRSRDTNWQTKAHCVNRKIYTKNVIVIITDRCRFDCILHLSVEGLISNIYLSIDDNISHIVYTLAIAILRTHYTISSLCARYVSIYQAYMQITFMWCQQLIVNRIFLFFKFSERHRHYHVFLVSARFIDVSAQMENRISFSMPTKNLHQKYVSLSFSLSFPSTAVKNCNSFWFWYHPFFFYIVVYVVSAHNQMQDREIVHTQSAKE